MNNINFDDTNNNQISQFKQTKRKSMFNASNDIQPSIFYDYPHRAEKKASLPNLHKLREYDSQWNKWSSYENNNYNSNSVALYPNPVMNSNNFNLNGFNKNLSNINKGFLPIYGEQNSNVKYNTSNGCNMQLSYNTNNTKLINCNDTLNYKIYNNSIINGDSNITCNNNNNNNNFYPQYPSINNSRKVFYTPFNQNPTQIPLQLQKNLSSPNNNNFINNNTKINNNNIIIKKTNMSTNMNNYSNEHINGNNNNMIINNEFKLMKYPSCDSLRLNSKESVLNKETLETTFDINNPIVSLGSLKDNNNINKLKNNEDIVKNNFFIEEKNTFIMNNDEDMDYKLCEMCLKRPGNIELLYCHHILCDKCIQSEFLYNEEGTIMKCFCRENVYYMKYVYDNKILKNNKKENNEVNDQNSNKINTTSTFNGNMYNILTIERIFPVPTTYLSVVKLSNIPWDLSQKDVLAFFYPLKIPAAHEAPYFTQGIHIIMNRTSGKTFSDAYIEFTTMEDANTAIETRNKTILKGRIVTISRSSQEELMKSLFPSWAGNKSKNQITHHTNTLSMPPPTMNSSTVTIGTGIIYGGLNTTYAKDGCFLTRDEVSAILLVCKNYKLHFSRKCAERPFENVISIISKIPWHIPNIINTLHRDHIFELLKLSLESLKSHLSKEYINISPTLMNRLIRSGLCCPGFTDKQKNMILNFSNHECPKDLELFVFRADKKKEPSTPNQSIITDSISSAYPSPPNSIKTISSNDSHKEVKDEIYTNSETSESKNTYDNIVGTTPLTTTSTTLANNNMFEQSINDNCTIYNNTNKTTPLEFILTENNEEEKVLIDNISNVLLNNSYDNYKITNKVSAVAPPSQVINDTFLTTTTTTTSFTSTTAKINENQKIYTPFSSPFIITTTTQSIIPIKTQTTISPPFMLNSNYNQKKDNSLLLTPNPIVNSKYTVNNTISSISDKEKSFINPFSFMESKEISSFTPLITSEGLINKNLQTRQNNLSNKFNNNDNKPFALSTLFETGESNKELNDVNKTSSNLLFDTQNDFSSSNTNINTIQTLKNIIQNLNNKCLNYDEKLKEVLEYNKQLESKIIELKKLSTQGDENQENSIKEEDEEQQTLKNQTNEFPSPSLTSLSSTSK